MSKTYTDIESKIRKDSHRDNFFTIIESDINNILNPKRGSFVFINCPSCDSNKISLHFNKGQFSYYICNVCNTFFVNPRPTKELLDEFYINSKAVEASTKSLLENEKGRRIHIFLPRAKIILSYLAKLGKSKGKLLEIGCSVGTFLDIFKKKSNFSVEGLDPSSEAYKVTKAKGLKVHKDTLENFKSAGSAYDVILSFETIEHVFSPHDFLVKTNRLLKTGGIFVFSTPNASGFDMMVLGKYYKNIHAPCHLNYFNINTIDLLLERAGFVVRERITPGILDVTIVRKQVMEGVAPDMPPAISQIIFNSDESTLNDFQGFLSKNRLSGNMLIFAEKTGDID